MKARLSTSRSNKQQKCTQCLIPLTAKILRRSLSSLKINNRRNNRLLLSQSTLLQYRTFAGWSLPVALQVELGGEGLGQHCVGVMEDGLVELQVLGTLRPLMEIPLSLLLFGRVARRQCKLKMSELTFATMRSTN